MPSLEEEVSRSLGKTLWMVEVFVRADVIDDAKEAVRIAFGDSLEYRLVSVLANSEHALPLSEIRQRCQAGRRAMLREGRLRLIMERMERFGVLINIGSPGRPRYQLNLLDEGAKMLVSMLSEKRHG